MAIICLENVKKFIASYGSITELSKWSGVSRTTLYRILNGERKPGTITLEGLVKAGMRKEDIFK